jgi:hypothetical protein
LITFKVDVHILVVFGGNRATIDGEHFPLPLSILDPKALVKMESTPYQKSPPSYKSYSKDGEYTPSILSSSSQKLLQRWEALPIHYPIWAILCLFKFLLYVCNL